MQACLHSHHKCQHDFSLCKYDQEGLQTKKYPYFRLLSVATDLYIPEVHIYKFQLLFGGMSKSANLVSILILLLLAIL